MSVFDYLVRRVELALGAGLLPAILACAPMTSTDALVCETEAGDSANVREVYGTWTMLKGYEDDPRPEVDLEEDYDVLVVQTGGLICRVRVLSRAPRGVVMLATYEHKASLKKMDLSLSVPRTIDIGVNYSFSGSCADPRMKLLYTNGASEVYRFRGKEVGDCLPSN